MDLYIVVLRLFHIFGGVFWAGGTFFLIGLLTPAVKASGPEGGKVMQNLLGPARMSILMGLAATLTALSGILLYIQVSNGFQVGWLVTGRGLVLTVGAVAGLTAWLIGALVVGRTGMRMSALGKEISAAGGPPSPDKLAELQMLQERQTTWGSITALLLALALVGMSAAEYVFF